MTPSHYALGVVLLLVALAPIGWASVRLRRRLVPDWKGAPARLLEVVLGLAVVIGVSEILGSVGAFRRGALVASFAATGLLLGSVWGRPRHPAERSPSDLRPDAAEPRTPGRLWVAIALMAVSLTVGQWTARTGSSLADGITNQDSLTYHLPHAARFVQEGSLTRLHYTAPDFPDTFHPSNSELLHGVGMAVFGRDAVSWSIGAGWLAFAMLAAWCVGRPFGMAAATLTAAAVILAAPIVGLQHAGTASNDVAMLAFLCAATALLLQTDRRSAVLAVAGIAAGLAVGTKLTALVPVAALTLGVFVVERRRGWRGVAALWLTPLFLAGAFWYVRNLVRTGSPAPGLPLGAGPLPFPSPRFRIVDDFGFSVLDYLGDADVWRAWFLPGLRIDFGPAWWLTFGLAALGAVLAISLGRLSALRALGVVAAVGAVGYVVTPTTALGNEGMPTLFASNLIYLTPALMIGLVILPVLPPLMRQARTHVVALLLAAALITSQFAASPAGFPARFRIQGIIAGAVVLVIGAGIASRRFTKVLGERSVTWVVAAAVAVVLITGLAGYPLTRAYQRNAYVGNPFWRWARGLEGQRIALAGFGPQYPFYGAALSNRVQYIGQPGPNGEFTKVRSCEAWRNTLRGGRFTYVALKPERWTTDVVRREIPWTQSDPAATLLLRAGGGIVFRFDPSVPDPGCGSQESPRPRG